MGCSASTLVYAPGSSPIESKDNPAGQQTWTGARAVWNSPERLVALTTFNYKALADDPELDEICYLLACLFEAASAQVSFFDRDKLQVVAKQTSKARTRSEIHDLPLQAVFCVHTLLAPVAEALVVPDLCIDPRFAEHPMVLGMPYFSFYAGWPLVLANGDRIGTVSILDTRPHTEFDAGSCMLLGNFAELVVRICEAHVLRSLAVATAHQPASQHSADEVTKSSVIAQLPASRPDEQSCMVAVCTASTPAASQPTAPPAKDAQEAQGLAAASVLGPPTCGPEAICQHETSSDSSGIMLIDTGLSGWPIQYASRWVLSLTNLEVQSVVGKPLAELCWMEMLSAQGQKGSTKAEMAELFESAADFRTTAGVSCGGPNILVHLHFKAAMISPFDECAAKVAIPPFMPASHAPDNGRYYLVVMSVAARAVSQEMQRLTGSIANVQRSQLHRCPGPTQRLDPPEPAQLQSRR